MQPRRKISALNFLGKGFFIFIFIFYIKEVGGDGVRENDKIFFF